MNWAKFAVLYAGALFGAVAAVPAAAGPTEQIAVVGLSKAVDILIDPWGVPHAFADNVEDAFFAQGFMTARDRLWEIDLMHRRRLGRMAAVLGPEFVPFDQAARLFLDRRDPAELWAALGPRVRSIAHSYVAGINAYVALTVAQPALLPIQFQLTGLKPTLWEADDLVRIQQADDSPSIERQVRRALAACTGTLALDALRAPLEPAWTIGVPAGLDPCGIGSDDLEPLLRLTAPLPWPQAAAPVSPGRSGALGIAPDGAQNGSNAWAIAPNHTATGRPILANDPHLPIGIPSPRYVIHLAAPGFDLAGGSSPGTPGVSNGHNDRIGFGRTNFNLARDDLFVLETKPDDPDSYRHGDSWEPVTTVTEAIAVKGAAPALVKLRYTRLGPVVADQPQRHRLLVARLSWMERPGAVLLSQLPYNLAGDWASFNAALAQYPFGTSFMYAEVDGHIGWRPAGWVPVRPHHDGLLPAPGDGRYDWAGLIPLDQLPSSLDPPRGWLANANQMSLPPDYPVAERKLGFDWVRADRYRRIAEVLEPARQVTLADSVALQHDTMSVRARQLMPLLAVLHPDGPAAQAAQARLLAWDARVDAGSAEAALFEAWWLKLLPAVTRLLSPDKPGPPWVDARVLIPALLAPEDRFGADPAGARDRLLADALDQAVQTLTRLLGSDQSKWSWGAVHTVDLDPALGELMDPATRSGAGIRGGHSGGDSDTVMARWIDDRGRVTGGAAYTMVLDVGAWDNSLVLNFPGQSADPRSPHYRDLYERWLAGTPFPLLISRDRIEAVAESRILLSPVP